MHTGRAFAGLQRPLLAHPVWRLIPDRTCNHPHPLVIPAQAGIQNPRLLFQLTPRASLHVWCLITRRTGYRPAPVRRREGTDQARWRPPLVIPAKAGIQNPRLLFQLPPRASLHVRCLITRRTGYRPAPVRRAGRLAPLRRCLAGMTGWSAGAPFSVALPA